MKAKHFITAVSAVLFMAGSAHAAYPERGHRYRPVSYELAEVQKLAHRVEDRAEEAFCEAERFAYYGGFRERQALVRLRELDQRATHFHRQVEHYRQNFNHTEDDFRALQRAFARASYALQSAHTSRRVRIEFRQLSDAMYELEMYAEGLFDRNRRTQQRRYRDRRHPRWGHGDDSDWDSDSDRRDRRRVRIAFPRVRVGWDWLND